MARVTCNCSQYFSDQRARTFLQDQAWPSWVPAGSAAARPVVVMSVRPRTVEALPGVWVCHVCAQALLQLGRAAMGLNALRAHARAREQDASRTLIQISDSIYF
jgi:hypothetical protein